MIKINKETEYSLLLLISLAKNSQKMLSLKKIADQKGLPLKYLEKIAKKLKKNKIILSKEGMGGGYFLAKPAKKIRLIDIVLATEKNWGLVSCFYNQCKREKNCFHKKIWQKVQQKINKEFKKITLNDLI